MGDFSLSESRISRLPAALPSPEEGKGGSLIRVSSYMQLDSSGNTITDTTFSGSDNVNVTSFMQFYSVSGISLETKNSTNAPQAI